MFVKLVGMKLNIFGCELWKLKVIYNMERKNYKEKQVPMVPQSHMIMLI